MYMQTRLPKCLPAFLWPVEVSGTLQGAFIQTIEALSTLGYIVMVSNQGRYFRLASYLASFTQKSIVIAMGIPALKVIAARPHSIKRTVLSLQLLSSLMEGLTFYRIGL